MKGSCQIFDPSCLHAPLDPELLKQLYRHSIREKEKRRLLNKLYEFCFVKFWNLQTVGERDKIIRKLSDIGLKCSLQNIAVYT